MRAALCQLLPEIGNPKKNAETVCRTVSEYNADLYIFSEMFLTDYSFRDFASVKDDIEASLETILECVRGTGKTVVVGGPHITDDGVYNSAYVISDDIKRYDKINLPDFGPFSERKTFVPGNEPLMISCCGFRIGVIVCYDIFFPELCKLYAMNGADAIVCISASPMTSRKAFERVIPARSVEDTVYMLFVNNIGFRGKMEFFGLSRMLAPDGDLMAIAGHDENITICELNRESIDFARMNRPTIEDTRVWMKRTEGL